MAKTISHAFTAGAIILLKQFLPQRGWYEKREKDAAKLIVNSVEVMKKFAPIDLPDPSEKEPQEYYEKRVEIFSREIVDIDLTVAEREACIVCCLFLLRNAILPANEHAANLITELDME